MSLYMVFDVESVGLHGEGFAVGWVVIRDGVEIASAVYSCDPATATGNAEGRAWVKENVPAMSRGGCRCPKHIRDEFWRAWEYAKNQGAMLAADCLWPVEARFLAACVDDDPTAREWGGPYPFVDIASVRLAVGLDPLGTAERIRGEMPVHNPQADARQSARLLMEALRMREGLA